MEKKVILVTGATSGIGKVTATELSKTGAIILIIARNEEKALLVKEEIIAETSNENIEIFIADLSSLEDVRKVAEKIKANYSKIDVLINNAGLIMTGKREVSKDGNELTLATNHLGPFLLTSLLFDIIKQSEAGRIVNVSSEAYKMAKPDFENVQLNNGYSAIKAYGNSKLYNLLFTYELSKRIKQNGLNITVNALHPGVINTGFGKKSTGFAGFIFKRLSAFFKSPGKGAETSIYLASSPEVNNVSGQYFKNKKVEKTVDKLVTPGNAKKLWEISEQLTGTKFLQGK